jgi:hypothetical protein
MLAFSLAITSARDARDSQTGSVAAVRHDDVAGDVSFGTPLAPQSAPTNDSFPRIPSDAVPGSMTALERWDKPCAS